MLSLREDFPSCLIQTDSNILFHVQGGTAQRAATRRIRSWVASTKQTGAVYIQTDTHCYTLGQLLSHRYLSAVVDQYKNRSLASLGGMDLLAGLIANHESDGDEDEYLKGGLGYEPRATKRPRR